MEMIKDYEVYGSWTHDAAVGICPKCSSTVELVPKEGHFNSKYWESKRNDGLDLYCCPNGCNVNFKETISKASKPLTEETLRHFYMMHNVEIDEDIEFNIGHMTREHTTDLEEHKRKVHFIFLKDFVYNYNGFREFHDENYGNKSNTEFIIDKLSGLVFFNIYSHEPFASNLYEPLYPKTRMDDILEKATKDGLCVWQSTSSSTVFGLKEANDSFIKTKFN